MTPRATPGNIYALFPCPGQYVRPLYVTGGNGDPLAKIHLPCDTETLTKFVNYSIPGFICMTLKNRTSLRGKKVTPGTNEPQ
jgi:hypothetical protein